MSLNTFKSNYLTPLHVKGLSEFLDSVVSSFETVRKIRDSVGLTHREP